MKQLIGVCIFVLSLTSLSAQNITISGNVTEADTGFPIPGVNIIIKNTSTGTVTDFDGNYTFPNVPRGSTLVFS